MEINESKFIEREITLRNMMLTKEVVETRRSLVRWLALALGIINPGESRQSAVAVLDSLLYFQFTERKDPSVSELMDYIAKNWEPMNEKTLRYHLLQLKRANVVNNLKGVYFLSNMDPDQKYNEEAWVGRYFDSEVQPIREKIAAAIKELKGRQ
ncbi:MAG: hypothetical protein M1160_01970 [Candidatus Marsarchaeota archaeon]|jgi:hypothetical protein|nr:hypothetical protein [Candidatus Marsarchaeota archaeon]MCL5111629.1 hypothetical protein [Candidatus Marsarchaeota archaeon]